MPTEAKPIHLLIDINSYFASMAQQENPKLRGKPVVIVKELGRTCIIAASKEAKRLGISTGCSLVQAKKLAPHLIKLGAEFDAYLSATNKLRQLFYSISPTVYIYSLDEAFVDLTHCQQFLCRDVYQMGCQIQDKIRQVLGDWVTANVGIGFNRLLAKMAAEIAPKGSVFEINQDNLDVILASVSFNDVCGVGTRLTRKLKRIGVDHPYQLRFYTLEDLEPLFGPFWAKELLKIAYGQEPHHLTLLPTTKALKRSMRSVGRSITTWHKVATLAEIKKIIYNLTREVIYKVRRMKLVGRHLSLALIGSGGLYWFKHQTFVSSFSCTRTVVAIFCQWLEQDWHGQFQPIRFVVRVSLLKENEPQAQSLIPSWQKQEALEAAMDEIDNLYGLHTIRSGLMRDETKIIKPEVTGFLGDQQYQFNYR